MEELINNLEILSNEIDSYKSLNQRLSNYQELSNSNIILLNNQIATIKELSTNISSSSAKVNAKFDETISKLNLISGKLSNVESHTIESMKSIESGASKVLKIQNNIDEKIHSSLDQLSQQLIKTNTEAIGELAIYVQKTITGEVEGVKARFSLEAEAIGKEIKNFKVIAIIAFVIIVALQIYIIVK